MDAHQLEVDDDVTSCAARVCCTTSTCGRVSRLSRRWRPTGAVFYEPLGTNPMIRLYRRLTPRLRSADEHPLVDADVALARRSFAVSPSTPSFLALAGSSSAACLGAPRRCAAQRRPVCSRRDPAAGLDRRGRAGRPTPS